MCGKKKKEKEKCKEEKSFFFHLYFILFWPSESMGRKKPAGKRVQSAGGDAASAEEVDAPAVAESVAAEATGQTVVPVDEAAEAVSPEAAAATEAAAAEPAAAAAAAAAKPEAANASVAAATQADASAASPTAEVPADDEQLQDLEGQATDEATAGEAPAFIMPVLGEGVLDPAATTAMSAAFLAEHMPALEQMERCLADIRSGEKKNEQERKAKGMRRKEASPGAKRA
jgi:hypothetical protein